MKTTKQEQLMVEYKDAIEPLKHLINGESIRIKKSVAQILLLDNAAVIINATVRYFNIKNIGLGVCEVSLANIGTSETKMIK